MIRSARTRMVAEVNDYLQGWSGYYGYCQTPSVLAQCDRWIRRRLRAVYWAQWKTRQRRFKQLRGLGLQERQAGWMVSRPWGTWRLSGLRWMGWALPPSHFDGVGLIRLADPKRGGDLLDRIQRVRQNMASEIGILMPKVRIRDNMRLEQNQYRMKIADMPGIFHGLSMKRDREI